MSIRYNIIYKGDVIREGISPEESTDILLDFAERYYAEPDFDINDLELIEVLE